MTVPGSTQKSFQKAITVDWALKDEQFIHEKEDKGHPSHIAPRAKAQRGIKQHDLFGDAKKFVMARDLVPVEEQWKMKRKRYIGTRS